MLGTRLRWALYNHIIIGPKLKRGIRVFRSYNGAVGDPGSLPVCRAKRNYFDFKRSDVITKDVVSGTAGATEPFDERPFTLLVCTARKKNTTETD